MVIHLHLHDFSLYVAASIFCIRITPSACKVLLNNSVTGAAISIDCVAVIALVQTKVLPITLGLQTSTRRPHYHVVFPEVLAPLALMIVSQVSSNRTACAIVLVYLACETSEIALSAILHLP